MPPHRLVIPAAMLSLTMLVACSGGTPTASDDPESPALPSSTPLQLPASPTPDTATAAGVAPASVAVTFSGLPEGTYPVHLHSICSGRNSFHISVLQSLVVSSGGGGSIEVPRSYFGRGLCLIVYTSPALSAVLTTRPI
jgi:hypothetical protein